MNTLTNDRQDSLLGAVLTSQIAGLIMAIVVMAVFTLFLGHGPLYPVQVIGSVIFGEPALNGFQLPALLAGLIIHQSVALVWGIVFGVIAMQMKIASVRGSALLGVAVAAVSMVDSYVFVPAVMTHFHGVDIWNREVPIFWNWAAHLVFGLSFGLYPVISAKLHK
jgi:hypothetical protein